MSVTAQHAEAGTGTTAGAGWAERRVRAVLAAADIRLDGARPWDLRVHDERLFRRVVVDGVTGLGDAYIDGWWDCDAVDQLFDRALAADLPGRIPFDRHGF